MTQIELEVISYKHWCKVFDLTPCDYKNLKTYCDIVQGTNSRAKAHKHTYKGGLSVC